MHLRDTRRAAQRLEAAESSSQAFQSDSDEKGLGRLVTRGLGLERLHGSESFLEKLHQLTVAAAVKQLGNQCHFWLQAPGTEPRSTTRCPGLINPSVSSISLSLYAARAR